jgi:hypothetical protein
MGIINRLRYRAHRLVQSIKHPRSPKWHALQKAFLKESPECANPACRSKKSLNVHHVLPYHLFPNLELHKDNLLTLCMDVRDCHLKLGHGGNFKTYNPHVRMDLLKIAANPYSETAIVEEAKATRKAA